MNVETLTKEQLIQYIGDAQKLELSISYYRAIVNDINEKIKSVESEYNNVSGRYYTMPYKPSLPVAPEHKKKNNGNALKVCLWIIVAVIVAVSFADMGSFARVPLISIPFLALGVFVVVKLISAIKKASYASKEVNNTNSYMDINYQRQLEEYPIKLEEYNRACHDIEVARQNDEITKQNLKNTVAQLEFIKQEVKKKIEEAKQNIGKFYSVGIIHPKYQGLKAISAFHEYLSCGSCDTLKEAMNKYDTDNHHDSVERKLDNISNAIYSLTDEFRYMSSTLENGLYKISKSFDVVNGRMELLSGKLDTNNYYSRISAECNKQLAEDVNTIRFYEDIRWIERGRS
ncbi:MAG: hypothetical protein IJB70_03670 [Clostridia bacterium]|nr:hypothetical protein [Clostridia bacterium]